MFKHAPSKHRRPNRRRSIFASTGIATAMVTGGGLLAAAPASADWQQVATCESGGNAAYNDGQFYGLYNFDRGTWQGTGRSGTADQASPAEQLAAAKEVFSARGASPWPVCGKYLSGGSSAPAAATRSAPTRAPVAAAPTSASSLGVVVLSVKYVGTYRADVLTLQQKLVAKGYSIAVDGRFGGQTEGAVRAFQTAAHITVDGLAGSQTCGRLN